MDIAAANKRCEAATAGPYRVEQKRGNPPYMVVIAEDVSMVDFGGRWDDAQFFAHARSDLPAALEALEEAQGALRELCRGHNSRGSDGPCDCSGCRILRGSTEGDE